MAIFQIFSSTGAPRKRDSWWSWLVCVSAALTWAGTLGFLYSFSVFLPVFMDYFNSSREKAAWVGSIAISQFCFLGQLSTTLITRFGARVTTLIGGAFCSVSLLASSFVNNIELLFFTYGILFGFGCCCTFTCGLYVMGQYFKEKLSIATGILTAGQGGGVLIMGPMLGALVKATSWQVTCRIMSGAVFVLCLFAVTFDSNVETDEEENDGRKVIQQENIVTSLKKVFDISVWKDPKVTTFLVANFIAESGNLVPQIHLIRYCEELGISEKKSSELLIYFGLSSVFARLVGGILCNSPGINALYVWQTAEVVAGLSTILVTLAATNIRLIVFAVIFGLSDGLFFCTVGYLLVSISPGKTVSVIGWNMLLVSFFLACGPPLAGLLADKMGSYVLPFCVAGMVTFFGAIIPFALLCLKRPFGPGYTALELRKDETEKLVSGGNHDYDNDDDFI